ncbi:MAG: serine hydrolase [Tissierellia bacterium]|nr:serine hydrolase [Tissierellia bacterium]
MKYHFTRDNRGNIDKMNKHKQRKRYKSRLNKRKNKYRMIKNIVLGFLIILSIILIAFFSITVYRNRIDENDIDDRIEAHEIDDEFSEYSDNSDLEIGTLDDEIMKEFDQDRETPNPGLLDNEIKRYLRKEGIELSSIGVAYYNLDTDLFLGINEDELFLAASTMKVPINILAYDLAFEDDLDLSQKITYLEGDKEGGTGILQGEKIGEDYELSELLTLMITESDNVATNMMYRFMGGYNQEYLLDTLSRLYGIHCSYGNNMTPNDAIRILKRIYYNEDGNPYYDKLIYDMKNTVYNMYFTKNLKGEDIAHKTGDYDGFYNDIGIAFCEQDFAFAVFTDNLEQPEKTLADLGKIIYDWHVKNQ